MKVTGIIAEYNPFHNGHAYQIRQIREQSKSDYVIVVMSGDYVQRGEPALIDKYARARMALLSGADLVLELPVLFSTASAPFFARGGCEILDKLGIVDTLSFGIEAGNRDDFLWLAAILTDEPDEYKEKLGIYLKNGFSFPAARAAVCQELYPALSYLLDSPNNILGIEYAKALIYTRSPITIEPLLRKESDYHSTRLHTFASATALRSALVNGGSIEEISKAVPDIAWPLLKEVLSQKQFLTMEDFSSILGYQLLTLSSPDSCRQYFDISSFLSNRIFQKRYEYQNPEQFAALLKTRNETLLHIKRSLLHILLNLQAPDSQSLTPYYTRILGMKKESSALLKAIKKTSSIPVITKLSSGEELLCDYYSQDSISQEEAIRQFRQSSYASNLYQMQLSVKNQTSFLHENTRQFPIL